MTATRFDPAWFRMRLDTPSPIIVPDAGRGTLLQLFNTAKFVRGAEIGVWKGGFAEKICRTLSGLQELLCVDPYESYPEYDEQKNKPYKIMEAYHEAREQLTHRACVFIRKRSIEAAMEVPDRSLDFVYIDGNHGRSFVLQDIETWSRKVRPGGVLAGHDYADTPEKPFIQVKGAVDEYVQRHGITPWFVLAGDRTPSFCWVVN